MTIAVGLTRSSASLVERRTFIALFESSVLHEHHDYVRAVESGRISLRTLIDLSRKADIPYALFWAPFDFVERQLQRKSEVLLSGISKNAFSVNSRGNVALADIELIVKDVLRKQQWLKQLDPSLAVNAVVDCLRDSRRTVIDDAQLLRHTLGIDRTDLTAGTKEHAFRYLIERFEARSVFVSQSVRTFMPQTIAKHVQFSGLCIKDKKVPFIFMNNRDGADSYEPAGRRVLTLMLLGVCVARGRFAPVSYTEETNELIANREYEAAEEILMPRSEISSLQVSTLDDVKAFASDFCVTPSAFLMRAQRLHLVTRIAARDYRDELRDEFMSRRPPFARTPKPTTALRKYNGVGYCREILHHMDRGAVPAAEVVRVLFQNKLKVSDIPDFRAALR